MFGEMIIGGGRDCVKPVNEDKELGIWAGVEHGGPKWSHNSSILRLALRDESLLVE